MVYDYNLPFDTSKLPTTLLELQHASDFPVDYESDIWRPHKDFEERIYVDGFHRPAPDQALLKEGIVRLITAYYPSDCVL